MVDPGDGGLSYRSSGVDIEAGEEAVRQIRADAESTYIPGVLGSIGGFAGLFELPRGLENPVLVTATDGVGTKLLIAQQMGRLDTVGIDLVAMSVNDVITIGARPLLFLDYIAVGRLVPTEIAQIVAGVAEGCRQAGCALVGGEMAEMPGLYDPGDFDVAGFCVGVAERARLIAGSGIGERDVVLGLASSGFHSNGYSLIRKVLDSSGLGLEDALPGVEEPAGTTLLKPTRIYVRSVLALLEQGVDVRAMAHITGGGMVGNLSRVVPDGLRARLHFADWTVPPAFLALQRIGGVSDKEMFATFNMGIGFVLVVAPDAASRAVRLLLDAGEEPVYLGEIVPDQAPGEAGPASAKVTLDGIA